jgi:hypothetical protein
MLRIANFLYSRLQAMKADPAIMALLLIFEPALMLYRSMFSNQDSQEGISMGNTAKFTAELNNMSYFWFDEWQAMVLQVFKPSMPEFKAIFPRAKEPFQRSQYDMRMVAVDALYKTLLNYPKLQEVAKNVAARMVILQEARDTQTEGFGTNVFTAAMIEDQRIVLADLMDDILCDLKKKYRKNIKMVENFFDLTELRKPSSDADARFAFKGVVETNMTAAVPIPEKLQLSANAACVFSNLSSLTELQFFFSPNASAADNPVKSSVVAMQAVETNAAEAGWAPGTKFIIVKNIGTVTAEFELQVTEAIEG